MLPSFAGVTADVTRKRRCSQHVFAVKLISLFLEASDKRVYCGFLIVLSGYTLVVGRLAGI